MRIENRLFPLLGLKTVTNSEVKKLAEKLSIPVNRLKYYNNNNILPFKYDLELIEERLGINKIQVMLAMGILNSDILNALSIHYEKVSHILNNNEVENKNHNLELTYTTNYGKLYEGDCITLLSQLDSQSVDLVFADPPFNLDKLYESGFNDDLSKEDYLKWCEKWIDGCIRILKDGGSLFLWNLPKWNTYLSDYLNRRLSFKHWISVDIKYSLPIQGRLYPSHYSLLYYVKGEKANTFSPDRLPMEVCKNCYREIKDYGGYKNKMNAKGINITDVWLDIPPVRHSKYKNREANELSIRLLDRIIEMSSKPGDVVFDPFGGSGTTYIVSELKERKWIGVELGSTGGIIERFESIEEEKKYFKEIRDNYNKLFTDIVKEKRKKASIWTDDTFKL